MQDHPIDMDVVWAYSIKPLLEERFYGSGRDIDDEFGWSALRRKLEQQSEPTSDAPAE